MHWIQTIRENLQLTQRELAHYLRLSVDMIRSVEGDRRALPLGSLRPAITLYQAIKDAPQRGPASDPAIATDHHLRYLKRLRRQYRRRLERRTGKLEEMQRTHASACSCLSIYQFIAQSLTTPLSEADPDHRHWIQWKIQETMQVIKDNDTTMQNLLAAEITGLKSTVQELEGSLFS